MSTLENFVAVDWRAGKDKIFFFFKDSNTYSRFDLGDNRVPQGYPRKITHGNWHDFHEYAKDLRFGFTTRHIEAEFSDNTDQDQLWLFYYERGIPMVCKYDQDEDKVIRHRTVEGSVWHDILPYFKNIVAGTWWEDPLFDHNTFRFLMNNGQSLSVKFARRLSLSKRVKVEPIYKAWPDLEPYKHRIITAAQNDRTLADSYYYIFLTNNEYITYNIPENKIEYGPYKVDDNTWPGLVRVPRLEMSATASGSGVEASVSVPGD